MKIQGLCTVAACLLSLDLKYVFIQVDLKDEVIESVRSSAVSRLIQVFGVEWRSWCCAGLMAPHPVTAHTPRIVTALSEKPGAGVTLEAPVDHATFRVHVWHNSDLHSSELCFI